MNSGPSTFRGNGAGCSSKFESLPDISRKLDTILQLLRNDSRDDAIQELATQQEQILNRLDQLINQRPVSTTVPSFTPATAGNARTTLLQNQQWGQSGLNQNDPITSMNNGANSWGNMHADPTWHQEPIQAAEPITVAVNENRDQVVRMLEDIQRKLNQRTMTRGRVSASGDLNGALLSVNEELSELKEALALRNNGNNDYLPQIYNTLEQLVNQCNENTTMLNTLQNGLNDIYAVLSENNAQTDITQLIEENESLRSYIQRLIDTIRNR